MKKFSDAAGFVTGGLICLAVAAGLSGCERPADIASRNLSVKADNYEVLRRVVFYNGITDTYMLSIEGYCALGNSDGPDEVTITCKVGPTDEQVKKHYLGLSDNVTYFVEQLEPTKVSTFHYEEAHGTKRFWETIQHEFDKFFFNLPLMPDAHELVDAVRHLRPIILTGCPRGDWSQMQKLQWAEKHFPGIPMVTCRSVGKRTYCQPGDILIDDITRYQHLWEEVGDV